MSILQKAKEWFASLSKTEQQNLIDELELGAGHLTNIRQLNAYIAKYGEIHQAKLLYAYEKIPTKVWHEDGVTIIDYGCGQGIAEMVLSDYIAGFTLTGWLFDVVVDVVDDGLGVVASEHVAVSVFERDEKAV